jgi:undecaprenyl-diphosphatase
MALDETLFAALYHAGSSPYLDLIMTAISFLGIAWITILLGPILWWQKRRETAFDVVVAVLACGVVTSILKLLFMRDRPFEVLVDAHTLSWGWFTIATGPAMPSGHTARAFAVAAALAMTSRHPYRAYAFVPAALIGLSRIYLGLHWPSDVLAGAVVGISIAFAIVHLGKGDNIYARTRSSAIGWLERKGIDAGIGRR